ncbi:MAG: alanyl-tRNA editing protein AlaXM [Candidatus Aenigmatarchaeota archaeon]|nr:alanyl-tRNA editing protein [Candidatus Aenigmarchaeota archaeon]
MTKKLYWEDSYLKEFEGIVTNVNGNLIELDQSCFYPTGGGEPNDTGKLISNGEEFQVIDVSKEGERIFHKIDREGLKIGDKVKGIIDWDRRYRLMKMHTAAHLLSALINGETGALITGGNLDLDKSRIDFNLETFDREKFVEIVNKANELIKQNAEVKSYIMKREEALKIPDIIKLAEAAPPDVDELRIVEIVGIDRQADGGNHVRSLKEIGEIEIVKLENKGKNNRRLYYTLKS